MSALTPEADIPQFLGDVGFVPNPDLEQIAAWLAVSYLTARPYYGSASTWETFSLINLATSAAWVAIME
jgi:hypothetical protein